jgi:hypothetical protein
VSELSDRLSLTSQLGRRANRAVRARGVGHRVDSTFVGHHSLLQTIEQNFDLPLLGMRRHGPGR